MSEAKSKSKSKERKSSKQIDKKAKKSSTKSLSKAKPEEKSKNVTEEASEVHSVSKVEPTQEQQTQPSQPAHPNLTNYYDNLNLNKPVSNDPFKYKCDGCYQGDGVVYCVNCGKIYCKICEEQIHVVPSNRNHERHPLSDLSHLRKMCYHHNAPLKYFCESCEEPICQECQMIGPHNNKLHKIISIFDSFKKKFFYLSSIVNKNLLCKYEATVNQVAYLDYLSEQVKLVKGGIEREIRNYYSEMIDELNSVEGKKLAVINYESSILQKDMNKMNEIINYFNELGSGNADPDMISFLLRFKQLNEMIEIQIAKPIKTNVSVDLNDFPNRIEEQKLKYSKVDKYEKILKLKDDIIWKICNDKKINHSDVEEEIEKMKLLKDNELNQFKEKSKNEIEEWAKLSDKYAVELQKYHIVCDFCGCFLDETTVNTACDKNDNSVEGNNCTFGTIPPPNDVLGSRRHFFSPPNKEFEEKINIKNKIPNPFEKNIYNDAN